MTYPPPGGTPPPGYGQQPQQPGYPPQPGGYNPQPGFSQPQQPGGYTPAQPGGYPQQPGYGGPGAPPPPGAGAPPPIPPASGGGGGGLGLKILGAVGSILLVAIIAVVKVFVLDGDSGNDNAGGNTLSNEEAEAAEQAVEGDCVPQEYGSGTGEEIIVDCGDPLAFWTITKVDNDAAVSITAGDVTDFQDAVDICGENVYARIPGQAWVDYNFVEVDGTTEQFFCLEAIQEPNENDQVPKTPGAGDCFDDDVDWWTVDCSSPNAVYEAVDVVEVSPPEEMSETDAESLASSCSSDFYFQVIDQLNRTGGIICGNQL